MPEGGAKPIEFELDGEVYQVAFTTNALCSLEDEFGGASIAAVGEMIASGTAGVRGARALFRCALADGRPEITPVQAGRIMVELGPEKTSELVQEAFDRVKLGLAQSVNLPSPDARGRLQFEAGGVRLTLSFNMNAQAEMETYFGGLKPEEILAKINSGGAGLNDMRALFRAALIDSREVTFEEAGRIMDRIGIKTAGEAIKVAYPGSFPAKVETEDEEEPEGETAGNRRQRRAARSKASPTKRPGRAAGTGKPS